MHTEIAAVAEQQEKHGYPFAVSDVPRVRPPGSVEEVLAPLRVGSPHHAHDVAAGMQVESAWLAHEFHAGFVRQQIALAAIAGVTAGHQVFPCRSPTSRTRDDVIQRQLAGGQDLPGREKYVLTCIGPSGVSM